MSSLRWRMAPWCSSKIGLWDIFLSQLLITLIITFNSTSISVLCSHTCCMYILHQVPLPHPKTQAMSQHNGDTVIWGKEGTFEELKERELPLCGDSYCAILAPSISTDLDDIIVRQICLETMDQLNHLRAYFLLLLCKRNRRHKEE